MAKAQTAPVHILFANAAFCDAFCEPRVQRLIQCLSDSSPLNDERTGSFRHQGAPFDNGAATQ